MTLFLHLVHHRRWWIGMAVNAHSLACKLVRRANGRPLSSSLLASTSP